MATKRKRVAKVVPPKGWTVLIDGADLFPDGIAVFQESYDPQGFRALLEAGFILEPAELDDLVERYTNRAPSVRGMTISDMQSGRFVIVMCHPNDRGTLAHEALHAIEEICRYSEIPITSDTEEMRCRMLARVIRIIEDARP